MKITIGGKEVDLAKALPIIMDDLCKLKKVGVNYPSGFDPRDPDQSVAFVLHFCQKLVPEVSEQDVKAMTLDDSINSVNFMVTTKEAIDRPTSGPSTSSDGTTVGDPTT